MPRLILSDAYRAKGVSGVLAAGLAVVFRLRRGTIRQTQANTGKEQRVATSTPIRFRPTIVLCVGERGREVGAQLSMLLPGLDSARQAGIALLTVDEERSDDGALLGAWYDPGLSAVASQPGPLPDDTPISVIRSPLPTLVIEGLRGQRYEHYARPTFDAQIRRGVLDDAVVGRIQIGRASCR